jgi:hypothetical protein
MKKLANSFLAIVALLLILGDVAHAQTAVSKWGNTPRGVNWPILNTATTPAGNASMGAAAAPTDWASIKGVFDSPITPTTSQALVVTGTFEFVGGGALAAGGSYTWLRYAIMGDDGTGVLSNQNTPTAAWSNGANAAGYQFDPRSGTADVSNGSGGGTGASGTLWLVKNANWNSTNSNGGGPLGPTVQQAPFRAVPSAGVYNWAISIQPKADGTQEIRYYFEKQHAASALATYWFGGTVIDPTPVQKTFNAICFSVNKDVEATCKQVNLGNVKAGLGAPITVTEAPFQSFYVNQWGNTPRGNSWPILNDANTVDGDAAMGSATKLGGWASLRGTFQQDVTPTLTKALVITGNFEYVGGGAGSAYTWLRYAVMGDSGAVLTDQNKPTAAWAPGVKSSGYQFCPVSGQGEVSNGSGGGTGASGTLWLVGNANWNSTNTNAGGPLGPIVRQAPSRAIADKGVYNWAISIQPLADGTNEIRYYFEKQHSATVQTTYWFGGTVIDPKPARKSYNYVAFGVNSDIDATVTQVKLSNVKVDLATPITVTEAPWQAYYLTSFSAINSRNGGWTYAAGDQDGNYSITGTAAPVNGAQLGAALSYAVVPKVNKAILLTGKMEFVGGGFEEYNSLGIGLMYNSDLKTDVDQTGYVFFPHSDNNPTQPWGVSQMATVGSVINLPWLATSGIGPKTANQNYTLANTMQQPAGAIGTAGVYDFKFSIGLTATGPKEIRYLITKSDGKYSFGGTVRDNNTAITKFNTINFFVNNSATRALKITDLMVDLGTPINIPAQYANIVDVKNEQTLPAEFKLSQNYPNPFNPTTNIEFAIPQNGKVSLVVYDELGRTVANLVNGELAAGTHNVNFNASNLASGVYFYKLISGNFVSVKKLMLLK